MCDFYNNYVKQCNNIGKSPSAVALEIDINKSTVTRWKCGGQPTDATVQKIADYFGVTVEELLGDSSEPASTPASAVDPEDLALLAKYRTADENTRAAIRLLLKL